MKSAFRLAGATLALALATGAMAQAYPAKPIRFVVGFPAGSSIDAVSRIVLDDIRNRTGATIVVENRAGALGALGIDNVQRSPADGYTLMPSSSATHSSGPALSKALQKLAPVGGLTHIARVVRFDIAVVTASAGPYKTAKALIDAARAQPDGLTYGYGSGTGQVGSAAFSNAAGIKVRAIPYKGQPAAVTDLLGSQVNFVSSDLGAVLGFLKQGSLTAVAVLSERRSALLPDVPTAREAGVPSVVLTGWIGIDGPPRLPADVIAWWNEQLRLSMALPDVQEKLRTVAMEPALLVGEPFGRFVESEQRSWSGYVKAAEIQPE